MCDVDPPRAYRERTVAARLPHTCYSCGFDIMPGEEYHYVSGVWDGRGDSFRRHLLCAVLEDRYWSDDHGCVTFGALREDFPDPQSWVVHRAYAVVMRLGEEEVD